MKTLYCSGCSIVVAKIKLGSQLRKGMVALCSKCEIKRKASDLASVNKTKDPFGGIFDDFFSGRRP